MEAKFYDAMQKHCYLWRLSQCLQDAYSLVDEAVDHLENTDGDPAMLEVAKVIDQDSLKLISEKLLHFSNKASSEASDVRDHIYSMMNSNNVRQEDGEESSEEIQVLEGPAVETEMPSRKRSRRRQKSCHKCAKDFISCILAFGTEICQHHWINNPEIFCSKKGLQRQFWIHVNT